MDSDEADRREGPSDLSPAEAFALVGHEHRVAILRALLAESRDGEYPASFARLRERAGIEVSAQFSYHLDELTGHFVRQTDEGYELRYAGWEIATSILAGTYNERAEFGPTPISGDCPECGAADLQAAYREEWFSIRCAACGSRHIRYPLPPGAIGPRSLDEVLSAFDRYVRTQMELARNGVCPGCFGVMEVRTAAGEADESDFPNGRVAIYDCQRCGNRLYPPLGLFLLGDERVRQFLWDHGRPPSETPFWAFEFCVSDEAVAVEETDPWQARVEVTADGETLVATVDEALQVTSATVE
ncbi:ArsR/SmtB family transcription factor [Natronomonas sp.]|uniref:ArsR/SmtB family transcription factor n=1 Tax=Natronomonas sp. TaxID=2184060 RepID=UPI002FC38AD9